MTGSAHPAIRRIVVGLALALALTLGTGASPADSRATKTLPPANGTFDYQLGGAYTPAPGVTVVVRDRTSRPVRGVYTICYVNAFQTQPDESAAFARRYPDLVLRDAKGRPVVDPGWPDEYLFDLSTSSKRTRLASIVGRWIDGCAADGFRAVEADNLDSYTRSRGRLNQSQALAFAALVVKRAHARGLAIGQKNAADLTRVGRSTLGFDFAVAEECEVYDECDAYTSVYGRQVYEIEYTDNGSAAYHDACRARGSRISILYRDRDVVPHGTRGYVNRTC